MNGQQLKNSILQLAIQGRLVPQDSKDEPASALLARIREEKQRLVKDKKIKKEKPLAPITDDEKPFDIPESWVWARLGEIAIIVRGGSPRPIKDYLTESDEGLNWIKIGDTDKDGKYINTCREKIRTEGLCKTRKVYPGDFLLTNSMSFGRPYITNIEGCIHDGWLALSNYEKCYSPDFLFYLLLSPFAKKQFGSKVAGAVVKNLNTDKVADSIFPLPPLVEQHRIVEKIEELLPLVEEYDEAQKKLDKLNDELPEMLKKSVLQQAIMGKLDTRNDDDEPASVLLKRIKEEKSKLIKEKKIKKEKPLAPITDDEKPFDIPESWEWVRLGEIASIYGGKRIPVGSKLVDYNTGHIYIRVADMKDNTILTNDLKYVPDEIFKKIKQYIINKDDLYITVAGTIGKIGEVPATVDGANLTENADKIVFRYIKKRYLLFALLSELVQNQIRQSTTKVGQPKLAIIRIQNLIIPLPPLAEQHRIVEKIEELLPLIDEMKKT